MWIYDRFSNLVVLFIGKNVIYRFTEAIFKEYFYCKRNNKKTC